MVMVNVAVTFNKMTQSRMKSRGILVVFFA
jgi:hypothetical protein